MDRPVSEILESDPDRLEIIRTEDQWAIAVDRIHLARVVEAQARDRLEALRAAAHLARKVRELLCELERLGTVTDAVVRYPTSSAVWHVLCRIGGIPHVATPHSILTPRVAERTDEVGPGPALEGRISRGRKWRALESITRADHVAEWRVSP